MVKLVAEVPLGDVLMIDPAQETLRFVGDAEDVVGRLIDAMVRASQTILNVRDRDEIFLQHEIFLKLQRKLGEATAWLKLLKCIVESCHDERQQLLSLIPPGKAVKLTACNDDGEPVIVLTVQKNFARLDCSDLKVIYPALVARAG